MASRSVYPASTFRLSFREETTRIYQAVIFSPAHDSLSQENRVVIYIFSSIETPKYSLAPSAFLASFLISLHLFFP